MVRQNMRPDLNWRTILAAGLVACSRRGDWDPSVVCDSFSSSGIVKSTTLRIIDARAIPAVSVQRLLPEQSAGKFEESRVD
jgi:hypothetical protein